MAFEAGSVVVEDDATVSTSDGFAGEVFDHLVSRRIAMLAAFNQLPFSTEPAVAAREKRALAEAANTAAIVIDYCREAGLLPAAGVLVLPAVAAASVAAPASGAFALFYDSSNGNKLSKKSSGGTVTVIGTES